MAAPVEPYVLDLARVETDIELGARRAADPSSNPLVGLVVNQDGVNLIAEGPPDAAILSVFGRSQVGKSTALNVLARALSPELAEVAVELLFPVGTGMEPETQGIRMLRMPLVTRDGRHVWLLDCEGFGSSADYVRHIAPHLTAICCVLSSTMIAMCAGAFLANSDIESLAGMAAMAGLQQPEDMRSIMPQLFINVRNVSEAFFQSYPMDVTALQRYDAAAEVLMDGTRDALLANAGNAASVRVVREWFPALHVHLLWDADEDDLEALGEGRCPARPSLCGRALESLAERVTRSLRPKRIGNLETARVPGSLGRAIQTLADGIGATFSVPNIVLEIQTREATRFATAFRNQYLEAMGAELDVLTLDALEARHEEVSVALVAQLRAQLNDSSIGLPAAVDRACELLAVEMGTELRRFELQIHDRSARELQVQIDGLQQQQTANDEERARNQAQLATLEAELRAAAVRREEMNRQLEIALANARAAWAAAQNAARSAKGSKCTIL